jgi:hypothetical protein
MSVDVYVGISSCTHGAVTISDVDSIEISEGGRKVEHFVDGHKFPLFGDEFGLFMTATVTVKTLPENFGIAPGTKAAFAFTGVHRDGGSGKSLSCTTARLLNLARSTIPQGADGQQAGGQLVFALDSADGDTSPLGSTA